MSNLVLALSALGLAVYLLSSCGPAGGSSVASCVELYSPENLAHRAFAFDGTITAIELREDPAWPSNEQTGEGVAHNPWVTFKVNRWYKGGGASEVGIWMPGLQDPSAASGAGLEDTIAAQVGTRLLVAGAPRGIGAAPEQGIAWGCGFTQPYTEQLAAEWEAAIAADR